MRGRLVAASFSTRRALSSMPLYYHHLYTGGLDPAARFPRDRYDLVRDELLRRGVAGHDATGHHAIELRTPQLAQRAAAVAAHDTGYVDRFLTGSMGEDEKRRIGLKPWKPQIVDRTLALVGGSLAAMEEALTSKGVAGNMAGGTHHAAYSHGAGYCIFNDIAICAVEALDSGAAGRVAVIDLDVHQGDGTAAIFASDSRVFTASVHCSSNFPFRKTVSDLDIALPKGSGDDEYLSACYEAVDKALAFQPDLVIFQAGVDALAEDALGHMKVTREAMQRRNDVVLTKTRGLPLVVLMGGGYSKPISHTVDAFADLVVAASKEHAARLA